MEKDLCAVDPFQPLCISYGIDQITYTSFLLTQDELELLKGVLQRNKDVFAWTHSNMSRIHPSMASHKLNVILSSLPIWKKVWCFDLDSKRIIQMEIDKFLVAEFIREVKYPN